MNEQKLYQNRNWLEDQYINKKKSTPKIAEENKFHSSTIHYWLRKFNIPIRSESESVHLSRANYCNLSQKAKEWINGELLGDGCLWSESIYSARFVYSSKFEEYINYISNTLNSFGIKQSGKINEKCHKNMNCYSYHYNSLSYEELLPIRQQWYPKGKKIVPRDIKLTPLTCRQWYLGDGQITHQKNGRPYIRLSTCCFTKSDVEWLIEELNNLEFKASRQKSNRIYISTYSTKEFLDYIGPCPVKCYQYRWRI